MWFSRRRATRLRQGKKLQDAEVQLSAQRLRELMLWHGKDEGHLPPAATLVNLSRDTIAALAELQHARAQLVELRAALGQLFWSCDSSQIRVAVLNVLGAPPDDESHGPGAVSEAPAKLVAVAQRARG
jgi:hypothetical protein